MINSQLLGHNCEAIYCNVSLCTAQNECMVQDHADIIVCNCSNVESG